MAWSLVVNLVGAAIAFAYLTIVFPHEPDEGPVSLGRNFVGLAV